MRIIIISLLIMLFGVSAFLLLGDLSLTSAAGQFLRGHAGLLVLIGTTALLTGVQDPGGAE